MKLTGFLLFLAGAVAVQIPYDPETGKVTISVGKDSPAKISIPIDPAGQGIVVFGEACKDAGSCTKSAHGEFYDISKNKNGKRTGDFNIDKTLKGDVIEDEVDASGLKKTIKVNVITSSTNKEAEFPGRFGFSLDNKDSSLVDAVLSGDKTKSFYLIPKDPKDTKGKGIALLGEEAGKRCKDISSLKIENNNWGVKVSTERGDKKEDRTAEFLPILKKLVFNTAYYNEIFPDPKQYDEDTYKSIKDLKVTIGKHVITLKKDIYLKKNKDGKYEPDSEKIVTLPVKSDILFPKEFTDKLCLRYSKDGDDYKFGVGERQNSVGVLATSALLMLVASVFGRIS